MSKVISIQEVLKRDLIGKRVRVCTYQRPIIDTYMVLKKKSKNVTDEQFQSRDRKYCQLVNRKKYIGTHKKFEDLVITEVRLEVREYDFEPTHYEIELRFENGHIEYMEIDFKLEHIYDNVYKIEYR